MPLRDRLLAVLVAVCWGVNFPATALALEHFPPLLMAALRFAILAVPTMLLVPRPKIATRWLVGVGLGIGAMQFSFLYLGMTAGMPAGLASLVLQASAPFTVIIAAIWLRERLSPRQALGIAAAVIGLAVIAVYRAQVAAALPVVLTLCGGLGWAIGNVCSRQARGGNPLHLTLWMSVVPPIPLFVLSLLVEGPEQIGTALVGVATREALPSVLGLAYIVVIATVLGYGIWTALMSRYPSSTVAPFSMLVPVVGVVSSWLVFGETVAPVELIAGAAVIGGVLYASRASRPPRPAVPNRPDRARAEETRKDG